MSTPANVSAPRAASNTNVPQLSRRALNGLKNGPSVEIWVECEPFVFEGKTEKQRILCSIHTALLRHFSARCKRELAPNDTNRVSVPFIKEPTKLVVGWMMAGGGNKLGTQDVAYPKNDLARLKILKNLAMHLEIGSLAELLEKDIAAVTPVLPPVPAAGSAPDPAKKKANHADKICHFCGKKGHIKYVCRERNALFVNKSHGPTYSLKDTPPAAQTSGMYSQASSVCDRALRGFKAGSNQPRPAKLASTEATSTKRRLVAYSGNIMARDAEGWYYSLDWKNVEMEIDWPETGDLCKVSGTARLSSW